jgi:hypothetical protein
MVFRLAHPRKASGGDLPYISRKAGLLIGCGIRALTHVAPKGSRKSDRPIPPGETQHGLSSTKVATFSSTRKAKNP